MFWKALESTATTLASVGVLGLIGYSYTLYYKNLILRKMEHAFEPGDPVLVLAATGKNMQERDHWVLRDEQVFLDSIVSGKTQGSYYLLIGEKGVGKSSMLIDAMAKIDGEGVAMFDAHADLEIFRVRLGKALDFEYHEDNIGSLFSIRGPRDASALLDIERAFNKLEKVALRRRKNLGKPLILVSPIFSWLQATVAQSCPLLRLTNLHRLSTTCTWSETMRMVGTCLNFCNNEQVRSTKNTEFRHKLISFLEQWSASNLATVIFNSDDYWVYERLKQLATRMAVIPVPDLTREQALSALQRYRRRYFSGEGPKPEILEQVYEKVGGRLAFLNRVAKSPDMLKTCDDICRTEKTWFLNQCWILGEEMDDDVMDQQKYASAAMVLAKALVDKEKEMDMQYDRSKSHVLPQLPLHEARQVMTRADFIQSYDAINIFTIDSRANVRADSVPMMNAFREICAVEGFDEHLEATLDRISAIESLGRTRELTIKDLWNKGKYRITTRDAQGLIERMINMEVEEEEKEDDENDS